MTAALALALAAMVVALGLAHRSPLLRNVSRLVGSPDDAYDYCTRSIECLPRVILRWQFHLPTVAWGLGLVFRIGGALWVCYVAARIAQAPRVDRRLGWLATGLFIYYLFLHGWSQSWYLLSLLPLVPFAHPRVAPAMIALCISAVAYYAVAIPFACVATPIGMTVRDLLGGAVTIIPPALLLYRGRRRLNEAAVTRPH